MLLRHAAFLLGWALVVWSQEQMYRFHIEQDRLGGAPDFSFLNRPLGAADRVFVLGGHFYKVGADLRPRTGDDVRLRFFGVNLCFAANFPEADDAARVARRLRRLGVNLVRLHHMDTSPDSDPANARSLLTTGPYPTLNPVAVARLRRLLDALRAEGIYVNLNLHVGYEFRPEVDRVPALPGRPRLPTQSKPLHIFYPRMVELQADYARRVIEALHLRDDPVLAMVEINNESSLVESWQRGNLEKILAGEYQVELDRQYEVYLRAKGKSREQATPADWLRFLVDRDRRYLHAVLEAVRASAGPLVPVAGTQMGYGGLLNLDSHEDLDYQDNHFYVDHYNFPNTPWDQRDWRIRDSSAVGTGLAAFLNMAVSRQADKPYTVSEFNQPWPNRQGAEIDPALAAFAAFQDWDGIVHFAYSHGRNWDQGAPNGFNLNGDWSKFANFGQSAWLFRTGAVRAGRRLVTIPVDERLRYQFADDKRVGNVAAFLHAALGYDPALALVHRVALRKGEAQGRAPEVASRTPAPPYRADTGEIVYDRDEHLLLLESSRAAGVFGFAGIGRRVKAGAVMVELSDSARGFVTLLLTPLDGRSLEDSRRMLLSLPGYTLATLAGSEPPRPQRLVPYPGTAEWWTLEPDPGFAERPSGGRDTGRPPVWMERVECYVTLRTGARRLAVYPLDGAGQRQAALPSDHVRRLSGGFRIHLQAEGQAYSPWYELVGQP
jgi:hypothetical protein